jgi:predicted cation transporter
MPETTTFHEILEMLASFSISPHITVSQTKWLCLMLGGTLFTMAVLEHIVKFLARVTKKQIGNGGDTELHGALRLLHSPEVIAIGGAIIMTLSFIKIMDGDIHMIEHVIHNIGWHEAALVGCLMFQSSQLGRFVDHMMAGIQKITAQRSSVNNLLSEKWFTFWALVSIGILSCILSEVAVAAAATIPFFLVNKNQSDKNKMTVLILLAAGVGIGGGMTNFAAPSIVVAAKIFGWSTIDTLAYLGVFVLLALFYIGAQGYRNTENTIDSKVIRTKPLWIIDFVNLLLWMAVLYFGVFNHSKHSMLYMCCTVGVSSVINFGHIFTRPRRKEDDKAHNNPVIHLGEQVFESALIFGFLAAIMFMGDMCKEAITWLSAEIPHNGFLRMIALFMGTNGTSALADNAFATYQLGPITGDLAQQVAVALASLIGGMLTIIGNAPNIVILNIMSKTKNMKPVKIGFIKWIKIATPHWAFLSLAGLVYSGLIYLVQ